MRMPYRITPDIDNYDGLIPRDIKPFRSLNGTPRSDAWMPVGVDWDEATTPAGRGLPVDFPALGGLGYAFSQRALELLFPLVGEKIEALPLDSVRGKYYVVNVLNLIDALDEGRSEIKRIPGGRIDVIVKHAFKSNSTDGQHIFKLQQEPLGPVYVSAEFKRAVEHHGLTGLIFIEIGHGD